MKSLGVAFIALLLASGLETSAQDNPFSNGGQGLGVMPGQNLTPCPDYKIVVITPPNNSDFKMVTTPPSKNLDPGIIFKPCELPSHLALAPQLVRPHPEIQFLNGPNQKLRELLKGQLVISDKNK